MLLQKCHSQKVAQHIATLNESESNKSDSILCNSGGEGESHT